MAESMSYTGRDIVAIRQSLVNKVPELTDKWKDFNESDLGVTLIELIAGAQDMQNFYFDTQAFETYLDTAVQDKNIRSLLRSMNYRIPLLGSAKGTVRLTYSESDETRKITIPKYTTFSCSSSSYKYVASDTVSSYLTYGFIDVPVMEGEYREKKVTKKLLLSNMTPSGNASRRIPMGLETVAEGSIEICQNGVIWKEVDDALLEYSGGYVFSTHKDSENKVYILLSCNFSELLPEDENEEIVIKYLVSSGLEGEVKAKEIDTVLGIDSVGLISVANLTSTYGAWNDIDLKRAKILARRQAQTMGRYITLDDYKNAVDTEYYIKDCVVKDWRVDSTIPEPYVVKIWAVDWNGNSLGSRDKESLYNKLIAKGVTDVSIRIQDVELVYFDIKVDLYLKTTNESDALKIRDEVENYLTSTYESRNLSFGEEVSISMLNSRIKSISPYIKEVIINSPFSDVEVSDIQFPKLGDVIVNIAK